MPKSLSGERVIEAVEAGASRRRGGNDFAAYQRWPKAKITLRQGAALQ
jgi:hypothetical protein